MTVEQDLIPYLRLKMNINFSDYESVWLEGYSASSKNVTEAANPYNKNSKEHGYWEEGWWSAFYGEEPIFDIQLDNIQTVNVEYAGAVAANDNIDSVTASPASQTRATRSARLTSWYYRGFGLLCAAFAFGATYNLYDMAA